MSTQDGQSPDAAGVGTSLTPNDAKLLRSIAQGESTALESLYDLYGPRCFGLAVRLLSQDHGAAENVVQDVFVRVWQSAHTFDAERGSARAWILTSTANACIDRLRRRTSRPTLAFEVRTAEISASNDVRRDVCQRLTEDEVRAALRGLPHEQIVAIELACFDNFTCTQIAERIGAPLGTVKGRMRLGLQKLRQELVELERDAQCCAEQPQSPLR